MYEGNDSREAQGLNDALGGLVMLAMVWVPVIYVIRYTVKHWKDDRGAVIVRWLFLVLWLCFLGMWKGA